MSRLPIAHVALELVGIFDVDAIDLDFENKLVWQLTIFTCHVAVKDLSNMGVVHVDMPLESDLDQPSSYATALAHAFESLESEYHAILRDIQCTLKNNVIDIRMKAVSSEYQAMGRRRLVFILRQHGKYSLDTFREWEALHQWKDRVADSEPVVETFDACVKQYKDDIAELNEYYEHTAKRLHVLRAILVEDRGIEEIVTEFDVPRTVMKRWLQSWLAFTSEMTLEYP